MAYNVRDSIGPPGTIGAGATGLYPYGLEVPLRVTYDADLDSLNLRQRVRWLPKVKWAKNESLLYHYNNKSALFSRKKKDSMDTSLIITTERLLVTHHGATVENVLWSAVDHARLLPVKKMRRQHLLEIELRPLRGAGAGSSRDDAKPIVIPVRGKQDVADFFLARADDFAADAKEVRRTGLTSESRRNSELKERPGYRAWRHLVNKKFDAVRRFVEDGGDANQIACPEYRTKHNLRTQLDLCIQLHQNDEMGAYLLQRGCRFDHCMWGEGVVQDAVLYVGVASVRALSYSRRACVLTHLSRICMHSFFYDSACTRRSSRCWRDTL
jgi:hypothetical protein